MAPFDLDACIEQTVLREIAAKTKKVLMRESNVVHVSAPITVVGDIHGQFYDLIEIFRIGGFAPSTDYLFLGDYVDRGLFSVETLSLLMCLKLRYPNREQLLRGNHESSFYTECMRKYSSSHVWAYFTDMFDLLTLSRVIDNRIFCVRVSNFNPHPEVPHDRRMADLVWGAGYTFGSGIVHKFLEINNMSRILRAHQLCMEGYAYHLFSVCPFSEIGRAGYRAGNSASILELGPGESKYFNVFGPAPENERDGPNQQAALGMNGQPPEYFL
ncbi:Metallo-dependent phosphatase-like protein [Mycena galopus ATCC 62051]|nr:Metallo-dependent phosphatase-like protein [Mycena galopus ATCC 62051]